MDNQPNKKDYEGYFAEIENRLNSQRQNPAPNPRDPITKTSNSNYRRPKSKKKITLYRTFLINAVTIVVGLSIMITVIVLTVRSCKTGKTEKNTSGEQKTVSVTAKDEKKVSFNAKKDDGYIEVGEDIMSKSVVFIDTEKNRIVAGRNMYEKMYPASTTKIMTLLVAVENVKDMSDTFTMTYQITDPLYKAEATVAGFTAGEVLTMDDLLYGTILPSGGDAAIGLAIKVAGSEEEFVKLMNKKAKELKLSSTHFANCTGLFDKENYTTAYDLSVILRAAMDNETCKKILATYKYTTSKTEKHPDGIELENTLFKYMYGTEPENAVILGGKTGYIGESGYCIASFGEDKNGKEYVCVTLFAPSRWPAVYDQINIYTEYTKGE